MVSSVLPSIIYARLSISESVSEAEMDALEWISKNTWTGTVVAGSLETGHLITSVAERRNIMDMNFLMQEDTEPRLRDLNTIYSTRFETDAVRLLNKYSAEYIILSRFEEMSYQEPLLYIEESSCFELVYDSDVRIYKSLCVIEESS